MALLEESNPLRGLRPDGASDAERVRSGRRTAVVALLCSLLWGFGFLSMIGMLVGGGAWLFLRSADTQAGYRRIALAAFVLGAAGSIGTVVWAL